jgi:hypothetical protein
MDSSWIGWALAGCLPLFGAVFLIEYHRANPLIDMRWLGTLNFLRFVMVGTVARIVLSEQTYGSVGLLNILGTTNEELLAFSVITVAASVAGIIAGAMIVGPNRLTQPVALAIGIVAIAAAFDSHATNLTRAPQMFFTQALIAFSTTLYIGPAILIGFARVVAEGGKKLTSFIILFGVTQSIGGLIGTALLSTYQIVREKFYSFDIIQHLVGSDPLVTQALSISGSRASNVIVDPALLTLQGVTALGQRVTIEANVLAYDDLFRLAAVISAITTFLLLILLVSRWNKTRAEFLAHHHS